MAGAAAIKAILDGANAAIDRHTRLLEVTDLVNSVDDWKGHKLEHFGELVICGGHTVLKGEGAKEVEREVRATLNSSSSSQSFVSTLCILDEMSSTLLYPPSTYDSIHYLKQSRKLCQTNS